MTCSGLPVIRVTTAERLAEIVAHHERRGVQTATPHFRTLEDGAGHKRVGDGQPAMEPVARPACKPLPPASLACKE